MSKTQQLLAAATPAPWWESEGKLLHQQSVHIEGNAANDYALAAHLRNTADAAQAVIEAARAAEVALAQGDTMLFWTRWDKVVAALAAYDEADK